ncbi:MAG: hypothetical protein ACKOGA_07955, partial [Planctomycetaceae bacterium]
PAATALLLTDRLPRALFISATCAAVGGVLGLAFSSLSAPVWTGALRAVCQSLPGLGGAGATLGLKTSPPTGPVVVLVLSSLFGVAFFLSPRHGVVAGWGRRAWRRWHAGSSGGTRTVNEGAQSAGGVGAAISGESSAGAAAGSAAVNPGIPETHQESRPRRAEPRGMP